MALAASGNVDEWAILRIIVSTVSRSVEFNSDSLLLVQRSHACSRWKSHKYTFVPQSSKAKGKS